MSTGTGGLGLTIDGINAFSIGYGVVGDLNVQWRWSATGGGLNVVSFSLALPRNFSHHALRQGAVVDISMGGLSLGTAIMADPNRDAWTFTADGIYNRAEHFNAEAMVDGELAASTNPQAIVDFANTTRGLGWNGTGNLPNASLSISSEDASNLNSIKDVLDRYCQLNPGTRWGLTADNTPYFTTDPTEHTLVLRPGTPAIPTVADDYASRVTVKYVSAVDTDGNPTEFKLAAATPTDAPLGVRETQEDITAAGLLSLDAAEVYAQAFADNLAARSSYAAAVQPAPGYLTTRGGVPATGWRQLHGQRIRQFGSLTPDGQRTWGTTDEWVVGQVDYAPGSDEPLTLTPVDIAPRTVTQVQAATTAATKVGFT